MRNRMIVICGLSASGKDSLSKYISENYNYKFIKSHTSRPMRVNESEDNPYYFVTREQFEEMLRRDEFIEHRTYNTLVKNIPDVWYYGMHRDSVDLENNSYVVVLDLLGLMEIKSYFGEENIISFFIDVDEPERRRRAFKDRVDFDITEWERRYKDDKEKFPMEVIIQEIDYIVENYDFDKCVKSIMRCIDEQN
jgi:guanylate kinase